MTATYPPSPGETISEAYARGLEEGRGPSIGVFLAGSEGAPFAPTNMRVSELRDAVDSWTAARLEHEHTSYYGAHHVRAMRAYWLGRLRAHREES